MTNDPHNAPWYVYILKCVDGSYYCGVTNDIGKRLEAHRSGKGSRYVRSRLPFLLEAVSGEMGKSEAMSTEYRVKNAKKDRKVQIVLDAGARELPAEETGGTCPSPAP